MIAAAPAQALSFSKTDYNDPAPFNSTFTQSVGVSDLDHANGPDVVVLNQINTGAGRLDVFLSQGGGTFPVLRAPPPALSAPAARTPASKGASETSVSRPVGSATEFADAIPPADLNGDGKTDIVIGAGSGTTGTVSVLTTPGGSVPTTATNCTSSGSVDYTVVGDFDRDGQLDVAAAGYNATQGDVSGNVAIFHGNSDGTLPAAGLRCLRSGSGVRALGRRRDPPSPH